MVMLRRTPSKASADARPAVDYPWNIAGAIYTCVDGKLMDIVSRARPTSDTTIPRASARGLGADFDGSSGENVSFASNSRNGPTGALTLLVHFECDTLSNYSTLLAKQGSPTTNCPFEFRIGSGATDSKFTATRANGSGFRVFDGAAVEKLTAGRKSQFAAIVFPDGTLTSAPTIYVWDGFHIGGFVTHTTTNVAGTGTGSVTDTTNPVILGNRSDSTVTRFDGLIYSAAIIPAALSAEAVYGAFMDMLLGRHVRETSTPIFFGLGAGGGSVSLTIADATHGHTADALGLTSAHALAIADALHAHAAEPLSLSTSQWLAVADALHAHAADNVVLDTTGSATLAVADALHAHAADAITLTTQSALSIADSTHGHAADNVVLDTSNATTLTIAEALHGHTADSLALSTRWLLTIADATHGHTADVPTLSLGQVALAIADALHAHRADVVTLTLPGGPEILGVRLSAIVQTRGRPRQLSTSRRLN